MTTVPLTWIELLNRQELPRLPSGVTLPAAGALARYEGDVLHIRNAAGGPAGAYMFQARWNADPSAATECAAAVRVVSASDGPCGICIDVADGVHEDDLMLYPDRITLWRAGLTHAVDTTDTFHEYRIMIDGTDIRVDMDGRRVLDGSGRFTFPSAFRRNMVGFGAGSSGGAGEAAWRSMRFQIRRPPVRGFDIPTVAGLEIIPGETVAIQPNVVFANTVQFADGRISVGWRAATAIDSGGLPDRSRWSHDGGRTWEDGGTAPSQATLDLGQGEILSLAFKPRRRTDGRFDLDAVRSPDHWRSLQTETVVLDIPRSVPCGGDDGIQTDGFLMDHGIVRLRDGALFATLYGTYAEDRSLAAGYPPEFNLRKYRTIGVVSRDGGRTWGDPVTVAVDPPVGNEGFCEAALVRAADGHLLCALRTGGGWGTTPHSPSYVCRSADEGRTWSPPTVLLDRGVWPNLCVMRSGIVACVTGRPGNWLTFSRDHGRTWGGAFALPDAPVFAYSSVLEVAPDRLLVVHDREAVGDNGLIRLETAGTFFSVRPK